jgi:hypothetical protein
MNTFSSKLVGGLALAVGITGIFALATLLLFFLGLLRDIPSLGFMGGLNDRLNSLASLLSAVLASALHPALRRMAPRLSPLVSIGAWAGAVAVSFGSWLISTGRADVELSSYYFFYGFGLIGIWLFALNRLTRRVSPWPRRLTLLGTIASLFMMLGLLGLYGILLGLDGNEYSPLVLAAGISFLGTGILYPIWALQLGRWIFTHHEISGKITET